MLAQRGDDEKALLAAAPPGTDRDKAERQQLRPKFEEGAMHAGFAMSGFAKMPVWKGSTYRGEVLSKEELLAAFTMSKRGVLTPKATSMTRTAISSTTKSQPVAENFIMDNIVAKGGQNAFTVIWEYELTNGRDIAALSDSEGEQEIATLPGAKFAVTEVRPYRGPLSKNTRLFDPKNMFVVKCKQTA